MKEYKAFEKWFKAQFGGSPNVTKLRQLKEKEVALMTQLNLVREDILHYEQINDFWDAAVKTHLAAQSGFKY